MGKVSARVAVTILVFATTLSGCMEFEESEAVDLPELTIGVGGATGTALYSNQSYAGNVSLDGLVIKMDGKTCVYGGSALDPCLWWLGSNEPNNSSNATNEYWDPEEWISFVYWGCPAGEMISAEVRHNGHHFPGSPASSWIPC